MCILGAIALLWVTIPAARCDAVTAVATGLSPTLTPDGLSLFYLDPADAARRKLTLATGVDVAAPLPALPSSHIFGGLAITPSERYIAFTTSDSLASSAPFDQNNTLDVYVFDTVASSAVRASLSNTNQEGTNISDEPSISSDGRYVVFRSSSVLTANDLNGSYSDVYLRDRCISNGSAVPACTPGTELESIGPGGIQSDRGCDLRTYAGAHSISADGRYVAFSCWATDSLIAAFAPGHTCNDPSFDGCIGSYVRDRCVSNGTLVPACTPSTELVSVTPSGAFPNNGTINTAISGDGTRVVYASTATDIVPEPGSASYDIFLYDRGTQTTQRLSTPPTSGSVLFGGETSISDDGIRVAFNLTSDYQDNTIYLWADCGVLNPTCGDNALEPGCEECDDGNLVDGDGCDSNCRTTRCGNGVTTTGEECDDGNLVDGDGCDSDCSVTACGNDIRTAGEACDDGNTTSGDGCSATCTIEPDQLTAGGAGKTDCEAEFYPFPQPVKGGKGIPKNILICKDDDPTCDIDGEPGDKLCVFRLAFCVNVTDPRIACTPIDVATVDLSSPKLDSTDYITQFNRGSAEYNLAQLGGFFTGRCTAPPVNVGVDCHDKFDCDEVGGDGRCSKQVFEFSPPLTATNRCSDVSDFVVPLKQISAGVYTKNSLTVKLKASASVGLPKNKPRNVDSDAMKLVCEP